METPHVPDEMISQLHVANERFAEEKRKLEDAMTGGQYRYQERVNVASAKLREVEREVEQIEGRIREFLEHSS